MNLAGRSATFHLSEDGKAVLNLVIGEENFRVAVSNAKEAVTTDVQETDDVGVWIRLYQRPDSRYFLLRWEYILGIEIAEEKGRAIGLVR